jgi:hypothetical protein
LFEVAATVVPTNGQEEARTGVWVPLTVLQVVTMKVVGSVPAVQVATPVAGVVAVSQLVVT